MSPGWPRLPLMRSNGSMHPHLRVSALSLVASVLTAWVWLALPSSAAAPDTCVCATRSITDAAGAADDVFTGTVVARSSQRRPAGEGPRVFSYRVGLTRVVQAGTAGQLTGLAGQNVDGQVVVVTGKLFPDPCDPLPLKVGQRYLFFVADNGQLRLPNPCTGTRALDAQVLTELDQAFPESEAAPVVVPHEVHRTKVAGGDPWEFTRLAAPGAALVVLGGLGLAIVRRISRED